MDYSFFCQQTSSFISINVSLLQILIPSVLNNSAFLHVDNSLIHAILLALSIFFELEMNTGFGFVLLEI